MHIKALTILYLIVLSNTAPLSGQEIKYGREALSADLRFIQTTLFQAHANPFTELDSLHFVAMFDNMEASLRDSMTTFDFLSVIKPAFAVLSDEHARINYSDRRVLSERIFLPFSLERKGNYYCVLENFSNNPLPAKGDTLTEIAGEQIQNVLNKCANFTTGFPDQRLEKAIRSTGLLYLFAYPKRDSFHILVKNRGEITLGAVTADPWLAIQNSGKQENACNELIELSLLDSIAYINFCSFSANSDEKLNALDKKLDRIFTQIKRAHIRNLIIDISQNSGGNSECGNMLIPYITDKKYLTYQCRWRKSDQYQELMKSLNYSSAEYERAIPGSLLYFPAQQVAPVSRKNRFHGNVFVVIGNNTFSSAIMFGTLIKDNRIARLAGVTPPNGHPNHFGELFSAKTPNTRLDFQFGVKEWLRPSDIPQENKLLPDIPVDIYSCHSTEELVKSILKAAKEQ